MIKSNQLVINIDWLHTEVNVFFDKDINSCLRQLVNDYPWLIEYDDSDPCTMGMTIADDMHPSDCFIFIKETDDTGIESVVLDTIIHECFHACFSILGAHGINLTADSNEVGAYFNAYLVKQITTFYTNNKEEAPNAV